MNEQEIRGPQTVSGSKVVVVMFLLGILATSALWIYWNKHLEPFMPMQTALNERFEGATARVDGGQRQLHKGTPSVLSVRIRIPFDPNAEESARQTQEVVDECVRLAELHVPDMRFDEIVVLMYHQFKAQDRGASQKKVSVMLNENFAADQANDGAAAKLEENGRPN